MQILAAGFAAVTDLGRFQGPSLGLSVNGALDQLSARTANILVGNADNAALIELTASELVFVCDSDQLVSVTGADVEVRVDGMLSPMRTPLSVRAGWTVSVRVLGRGLRAYIAVHGGLQAPTLLGSCAPDSMIGFGIRLTAGDDIPEQGHGCAVPTNPFLGGAVFSFDVPATAYDSRPVIPVTDGPDLEEFGASAALLYSDVFSVGARSNHVGLRLSGRPPHRETTGEVLSRGVPVGAIEVPSTTDLLLLHRGRGVTAGYPVLAVVTGAGLDRVAQLRPGDIVRFRRSTLDAATQTHLEQHLAVERFRQHCWNALRENGIDDLGVGDLSQTELISTN
ncbi:5-oxoprolinase subunit C family protein [Leifsonia shinshuensis]|uniref:Biotin-dependent carboxyltransferase family protein n=1 Tax=Leifsonia shinshuensis TaxID=150026 RepID=A0A7G6YE43_9MICO|nr:biotin-dependent carboxyltransferase family protein [Leifsonia shinshuensis]QNE36758.1 biotin-dependent carboxyltransferase family protein [Leifsonia shinshuensis]